MDGQGAVSRLIAQLIALGLEFLDLPLNGGELRLHRQRVGDGGCPAHDAQKRLFGSAQISQARVHIHRRRGDVLGLDLFIEDLERAAAIGVMDRGERRVPFGNRDSIGDRDD